MTNKLKYFREKSGLSAESLAELAHTSRQQIYRLEKNQRKLTREWAERLAPHLDVTELELMFGEGASEQNLMQQLHSAELLQIPIIGEVSAGTWLEQADIFSEQPMGYGVGARDPRFPADAYFSVHVRGNSINNIAPDGSCLICVDLAKAGINPNPGDIVIIQRTRDQGSLIETTAKLLKFANNVWELWPDSDDPAHQEPLIVDQLNASNGDDVRVIALVVGFFKLFE